MKRGNRPTIACRVNVSSFWHGQVCNHRRVNDRAYLADLVLEIKGSTITGDLVSPFPTTLVFRKGWDCHSQSESGQDGVIYRLYLLQG